MVRASAFYTLNLTFWWTRDWIHLIIFFFSRSRSSYCLMARFERKTKCACVCMRACARAGTSGCLGYCLIINLSSIGHTGFNSSPQKSDTFNKIKKFKSGDIECVRLLGRWLTPSMSDTTGTDVSGLMIRLRHSFEMSKKYVYGLWGGIVDDYRRLPFGCFDVKLEMHGRSRVLEYSTGPYLCYKLIQSFRVTC